MYKIASIILISLIYISSVFAEYQFPNVPEGCFDNGIYCSKAKVIKKMINGKKKKVINIKIFLVGSVDDYDSVEDVADLFFDFNQWDDYASDYRDVIRFKRSLDMGEILIDGILTKRHYAHYKIRAPFPIRWTTVRTVGYHKRLDTPIKGALFSAIFENQTEGRFEIPGEPDLIGGEGFKYNSGEFHIALDDENDEYNMFFTADVIPGVDFLPRVAKPYVHAGILAILKGMFEVDKSMKQENILDLVKRAIKMLKMKLFLK